MTRVAVVAPHPDDEVLGCASVLTAFDAIVVHATDGVPPDVTGEAARELRVARDREAQDVEARADVPDAPRRERRDRPAPAPAHAPASRRMSFSTPAAVTSAPAPGPRITSGFAL